MIHQLYYHNLFIEILDLASRRNVPDWVFDNIERGVTLSRYEYSKLNEDQDWNGTFFINDRYQNDSFYGGVVELAWILSYIDTILTFMQPCLTYNEQYVRGLDFFISGKSYQLKAVELGSYGALQVQYDYLNTKADYLVLIDRTSAKSFMLPAQAWEQLRKTSYNDVGRKMFWVDKSDVVANGGEVRDLPEFVTRSKLPKELT
jgi:hypothetical protein